MNFPNMTELIDHYKRLHKQARSHSPVIVYEDTAGRLGLWNPANQVYDWWQCTDGYNYVQSGSTAKRGKTIWKSREEA